MRLEKPVRGIYLYYFFLSCADVGISSVRGCLKSMAEEMLLVTVGENV